MRDNHQLGLIGTLHGLRGIAALTVVIGHSIAFTGVPLPSMSASMGVMLFFALSGFLMAHLYIKKPISILAAYKYARARFARIYPLFALVCILSSVLYYNGFSDFPFEMTINELVIHLLGAGELKTIWTISTEFQFYILFIFFWMFYSKIPNFKNEAILTLLVFTYVTLWLFDFPGDRNLITGYLQVFCIGMASAILLPYLNKIKSQIIIQFILISLMIVYVGACFLTPWTIGERWVYHSTLLNLMVGGIVVISVLADQTALGRFLGAKPFFWLGEISLGMYLLHRPIMYFMDTPSINTFDWYVKLPTFIFVVVAISLLVFLFIEKPARSLLTRSKI